MGRLVSRLAEIFDIVDKALFRKKILKFLTKKKKRNGNMKKKSHSAVISSLGRWTGNNILVKGLVINYGEGGGLQNGKIAGPKLFAPPLKTGSNFSRPPPLVKSGNFSRPPYNMAKT